MYDVVIIGSGPGGYVAALKGAHLGGKVALVEGGDIGGTCLNVGCIPTKALVHSASSYLSAKSAKDFGVECEGVTLNFENVMAHKQKTVDHLVGGVEALLKGNKVALYRGYGKVMKPGEVEVGYPDGNVEVLKTKNIILATGSSQRMLPVDEETALNLITSDDALSLSELPSEIVIIGAGVLGIEFANIFNGFGVKVDLIEIAPSILPQVDEEIARRLSLIMKRKGINIHTSATMKSVRKEGDRKILVAAMKDGTEKEFHSDSVLLCAGRIPNFGGIDLEALGVEFDRRGIKTDDTMRTNVEGIYAIGDVVGRTYLAHVASAEALVAIENILGQGATMDYSVVPSCVFSIPVCASLGLKEGEAKAQGTAYKVSKFPFTANGKARSMGETEGLVKVIADEGGKILGMHILGPHADDLIHLGAMAMKSGLKADEAADMIYAHPTLSEAVMEAFHGCTGKPIHLLSR